MTIVPDTHSPQSVIRGNEVLFICDECGKRVKDVDSTKINKGKNKEYVYCPECLKKLYPKYKKVTFNNPDPMMKNMLNEALARYEKLR